MKTSLCDQTTTLTLSRREMIQVEGPAGTAVMVTGGEVWATRHHDTRDYILAAGDVLEHLGHGKTLLTANRDARVVIRFPSNEDAGWGNVLRRLCPAMDWRPSAHGL